jgi:hypothetical protein
VLFKGLFIAPVSGYFKEHNATHHRKFAERQRSKLSE